MQNITQTLLPGLQPLGTGSVFLTLNGTAIATLSPQEAALYPSLFKIALGPKAILTSTSIPGTVAADFLKRSGLNKKQLHDIWTLSDSENQGFLEPNGFFKACRLVAHAQSGSSISQDLLSVEPQTLPYFEGAQNTAADEWKLSQSEIARYAELYRKEGGATKLDGSDARSLLLKSGLSSSDLCEIWDLADVDKDGKLTFGEFIVIMQLVTKVREGKSFVPSELPATLSEYLNTNLPDVNGPDFIAGRSGLAMPTTEVNTPVSPSRSKLIDEAASANITKDLRPASTLGFGNKDVASRPSTPRFESTPVDSSPTLLAQELLAEQQDVAHQLGRRRSFRKQMLDGRSRLESVRAQARETELELVNADNVVSKLQDSILSIQQQITESEAELDEFRREAGQVSLGTSGDIVLAVAAIRESLGENEREVLELRAQLERIQREKCDLRSRHQVAAEKKRQADQDRNLLIVGLESDRSKLVAVRAERLKLWEQRHQLTRELTTKTFDQLSKANPSMGALVSSSVLVTHNSPVRRDKKGVRADVVETSPSIPVSAQREQPWSRFSSEANDPLAGAFAMPVSSGALGRRSGADSPQFGAAS